MLAIIVAINQPHPRTGLMCLFNNPNGFWPVLSVT